jgi:ComF family protein
MTLLPYRDPCVRAAIHLAKFHHHLQARQLLGAALATYCRSHPVDCIIPVPLSGKRYRERGYNQVIEIINAAQKINPSISFTEQLLVRSKHTRPQTELTRDDRLTNVTAAFSLRTQHVPANIRTLNVVLLDDVVTTGSTLQAARAALAPLRPKSITCVALAG